MTTRAAPRECWRPDETHKMMSESEIKNKKIKKDTEMVPKLSLKIESKN